MGSGFTRGAVNTTCPLIAIIHGKYVVLPDIDKLETKNLNIIPHFLLGVGCGEKTLTFKTYK